MAQICQGRLRIRIRNYLPRLRIHNSGLRKRGSGSDQIFTDPEHWATVTKLLATADWSWVQNTDCTVIYLLCEMHTVAFRRAHYTLKEVPVGLTVKKGG
jgi:hypothetical protein